MFGFLKDKLKKAAAKFTRQVEESVEPVEEKEEIKEEIPRKEKPKPEPKPEPKEEKKGFFAGIKQKFAKKEKEEAKEEAKEAKKEAKAEEKKPEPKKEEPKPVKKEEKKPELVKEKPKAETKPEPKPEPKPVQKVEVKEEKKPEPKPEPKPEEPQEAPKKKFFTRFAEKITKTTLSEEKFNDLFWELELALLENNVAVEVIEKIKQDLAKNLVNVPISRTGIDKLIMNSLKNSIEELFDVEPIDIVEKAKQKQPFIIAVVGVNGSGKTTSIAKLVTMLEKNGLSSVLAAADTFRSAAIEQLQEHADKLGVKMIKHDYGSDAAAVAFDAIGHAKAKGRAVVIIDTAGRTHINQNLMDELKKVIRVAKPDMTLFVGDSLTGNDAVEQARAVDEEVGIDGNILTKVDVDEKGGSAISISYVTKKPILYVGTGQEYGDFKKFTPSLVMQNLQLNSTSGSEEGEEEE
ncbi:signal recognition particle-docking protein FtsY [Candidatus Woesearchaeota archaeon]|nr:signal recognition particle-docking protein FtsY [Candidatus Woesearchaeota archaeon]